MLPFFENRNDSFSASVAENLTFPPASARAFGAFFYLLDGCAEVTVRRQAKRLEKRGAGCHFPQPGAFLPVGTFGKPRRPADQRSHPGGRIRRHPAVPASFRSLSAAGTASPQCGIRPAGNSEGIRRRWKRRRMRAPAAADFGPVLPGLPLHQNLSSDSLDLTYQIVHYISNHFGTPSLWTPCPGAWG